jgi:hypothetical protein
VTVSFHELAERELNDAAQYYESESAGLGAAFLTEIERCCGLIVAHPHEAIGLDERSGAGGAKGRVPHARPD